MKLILMLVILSVGGSLRVTALASPQGKSVKSDEQSKQRRKPGHDDQPQNRSVPANQDDSFLLENTRLRLENPPGLNFQLRTKENQRQFYPGELIRLELSFSSTRAKTYILNAAAYDRSGRLAIDHFVLDRLEGTADPLEDYFGSGLFNFFGGGLSSMPELSEKAEVVKADLNEWIRFDTPGRFRLYVTSGRVGGKPAPSSDGEMRSPQVISNVIEFEILPADEKWSRQKLTEILAVLDLKSASESVRTEACRSLRFLGTPAAVSEMVQRSRGQDQYCDFQYDFGLIGSPHREFVSRTMERALISAEHPVVSSFVRTLALLSFSNSSPPLPPYPLGNDELIEKWYEQLKQHQKSYDQMVLNYLQKLLIAIPHKQKAAKAASLQTVINSYFSFKANERSQIQELLVTMPEVFGLLPVEAQLELLSYKWNALKHTAMLRVLRQIFEQPQKENESYQQRDLRSIALRRLYELSPEDGRQLILEEIRVRKPRVKPEVLGLLPEATLPELDEILASNLEKSVEEGRGDVESISRLIQRYASPGVMARVQKVFESSGAGRWACNIQESLLAYFLRIDPMTGGELLNKALAARGQGFTRCYPSTLSGVARLQMSSLIEEAANTMLEEDDGEMVLDAATVLGRYGPAAAEQRLWQRLERMYQEAEEAKKKDQTQIEQALRNALINGQAWLAPPEKLKRLQALCVSNEGRKELGRLIDGWNQTIHIALSPFDDRPYSINVAHYSFDSLESLKQKLRQFPEGTVFTWAVSGGAEDSRARELFREFETYLAELGMKLGKVGQVM